jgi:hypothetical protein
MQSTNHKSQIESSSKPRPATCAPCSDVVALIVNLNDPQVCEAVRCLFSRAERFESNGPRDQLYFLDLLTVPQVASALHKSEEWVRRHKRDLGVIALGGCGRGADLLFARAAIKSYLERHATPELKRLVR